MTRDEASKRIAVLWLVLPVPALLLVTAQTLSGKYGDDSGEAWNWLLAQLAPILALIIASAFSAPSKGWREKPADTFRWRTAAATSFLYGAVITGLLLIEPVLQISSYELFARSTGLLALLQGVVVAAIGSVIFDGR